VSCNSASEAIFPIGLMDVNKQQLDLRTENSWTMRLHEVNRKRTLHQPTIH
jgi:hypothetical protein